ncbi:MAG: serine hydrolase domain-containing protein [Microthrixaceae bacterium]
MDPSVPVGAPEAESAAHTSIEDALAAVQRWDADFAAAAASSAHGMVGSYGDTRRVVRVASISKLATARAVLLAIEEGAMALADPLGPQGATVAHLLCHAGGYDFDSDTVIAAAGTRRIYSNTCYEVLARHVEDRTGIAFADYLAEGVLDPLGMASSELRGSPAKDLFSSVEDLLQLLAEYRRSRLLDPSTARAARQVQMGDLDGILPGWGAQRPCDWGFGPELRGNKSPHWSGSTAQRSTHGHFGGSGTMLWLDPDSGLGCVALSNREFGDWSVRIWPGFSDGVRLAGLGLLGSLT